MKLLFKQRFFSWLDSYDVYDEAGNTLFEVKGELAFGHQMRIYDANGGELGCIKQKFFAWPPKFEIYSGDRLVGCINKEFAFFQPKFNIDFNGWRVEGDFFEWDYTVFDASGSCVATVSKEIWNFTDTYSIDVEKEDDAVSALMLVLAIDAEKCSRN